ncbi:MAG: hypothetical protein WCF96_04320 [Eubacteriales bacterium]
MNSLSSKKILLTIGIVVLIAISGVVLGVKFMNPAPTGAGDGKEIAATVNSGSENPSPGNPVAKNDDPNKASSNSSDGSSTVAPGTTGVSGSGGKVDNGANLTPVPPAGSEKLQTFDGYFIDQDCFIAYENPWEDNKDCLTMEACAASGYGIAILQGDESYKFYYFDGNFAPKSSGGQDLAAKLINNTQNTDHIYIEVKGRQIKDEKIATSGQTYGIIQVSEMKEVQAPALPI